MPIVVVGTTSSNNCRNSVTRSETKCRNQLELFGILKWCAVIIECLHTHESWRHAQLHKWNIEYESGKYKRQCIQVLNLRIVYDRPND